KPSAKKHRWPALAFRLISATKSPIRNSKGSPRRCKAWARRGGLHRLSVEKRSHCRRAGLGRRKRPSRPGAGQMILTHRLRGDRRMNVSDFVEKVRSTPHVEAFSACLASTFDQLGFQQHAYVAFIPK